MKEVFQKKNKEKLDSVQSYDSEIFSVGAIQKTVNIKGKGEFPKQVSRFKKEYLKKFKEYFEDCGWILESDEKMYFKDLNRKLDGSKLKKEIRKGFDSTTYAKKIDCKLLEPIVKVSKDIDFQGLQVVDVQKRLFRVTRLTPKKYNYKIQEFLKSKLGKAVVLDHHINRSAYVKTDLGKALDNFFIKKDKEVIDFNKKEKDKKKHKSKVSRNPNDWGDNHSIYEKSILDYYGKNRRMSKINAKSVALSRYKHLKTEL